MKHIAESFAASAFVGRFLPLAKCLFVGVALAAIPWCRAQVVVGPVGVVANTLGGTPADLFDLRGTSYVNGQTSFSDFTASRPAEGTPWLSDVFVPTGYMIFDLGSSWTLNGVALWQKSHFYSQDIQQYRLSISDDFTFTTGVTVIGTFTPAIEPVLPSVDAFAPVTGQYVKWEVLSNYGNGFGTHAGEIAFSAAAVPEPAASAALAGLMALLAARRLRRRRASDLRKFQNPPPPSSLTAG